jgi:hypothetical protein
VNRLRDIQTRFAAALRGEPAGMEDLVPDFARRVAVHRATIAVALVTTLGHVYPATRRIVGAATFEALASAFIAEHPPRDPVLANYGAGLPAFLAAQPLAASLPYLQDVARLEWLRHEAYFAENTAVLDAGTLDTTDPDAMSELIFTMHPATQLMSSPFPVYQIWRVNQPDVAEVPALNLSTPEHVIVTRPAMEVITRPIPHVDAAFVRAISVGATLGAAVETAFNLGTEFDVTGCLAAHFVNGTFAA